MYDTLTKSTQDPANLAVGVVIVRKDKEAILDTISMVLTSFFQYCEASSVLPDAEEVLRTLLATRKLNTVLLRGRRLCSVPHLIPRCVELCAGTTCTPQGECCT